LFPFCRFSPMLVKFSWHDESVLLATLREAKRGGDKTILDVDKIEVRKARPSINPVVGRP